MSEFAWNEHLRKTGDRQYCLCHDSPRDGAPIFDECCGGEALAKERGAEIGKPARPYSVEHVERVRDFEAWPAWKQAEFLRRLAAAKSKGRPLSWRQRCQAWRQCAALERAPRRAKQEDAA